MRVDCTTSFTSGRQIVIPTRELYDIQLANRAAQHDPVWKQRYDNQPTPVRPRSPCKNLCKTITASQPTESL